MVGTRCGSSHPTHECWHFFCFAVMLLATVAARSQLNLDSSSKYAKTLQPLAQLFRLGRRRDRVARPLVGATSGVRDDEALILGTTGSMSVALGVFGSSWCGQSSSKRVRCCRVSRNSFLIP